MAVDHNNPQSRNEEILIATIDGNEYDKAPQSRMEELLLELKETIEEGGGGGGTTNYENLSNQPQVNGETLIGNKTGADLGLVDAVEGKDLSTNDYDDNEKAAVAAATSAISAMKDGTDLDSFGDVETALARKQGTLTAGDYISINNNEIKVSTSKGTELHTYKFTTQNGGYGMMIEKYVKGTKVSETTYSNGDVAGQEIDIDGVMTFGYSYAGYLWHYTLLVDSREHLDGQTVSWYYSNPVEYTENFDIAADESKNLVLKEDLDAAVSAAYHHAGTKTVAQLTHDLLVAANEGNVYNITDSGTTTSDFIEGIGKTIDEGSNVGICKVGNAYMFDLLSGFVDTTNFVQKSQTAGLLKNDGTVDTTIQGDVATLKSGLTNYQAQNDLNLEVPDRKNVLPNGVKSGSFAGVEWTLNDDGSITFNGTATQQIYNKMYFSKDLDLPVGEYIYNGGSALITFQLANKAESQAYYSYADYSGYIEVTQAMVGDMIARLIINNGTVLNNVTIYPMIRPKSIESGVYAPYIPSVESRLDAVESGLTELSNSRYYYNIDTSELIINTSYIRDLPTGYTRLNTMIASVNVYKNSNVYSESIVATADNILCSVKINNINKLEFVLKGVDTVGANTFLRVEVVRFS